MPVEKIPCPVCGTPMNHHADKLLYTADTAEDGAETVQVLFRCPACGAGASQTAKLA